MKSFKQFFIESYGDDSLTIDRKVSDNDLDNEANLDKALNKLYKEYKSKVDIAKSRDDVDSMLSIRNDINNFEKIYKNLLSNMSDSMGRSTPIDPNSKIAILSYKPAYYKFRALLNA